MVSRQVIGIDALATRRSLLRMGAGGMLVIGLAACGGGGGGGGDSTAEKQQALRDAFAKLRAGMVWTDVEELVGFPANNTRTDLDLRWVVDGMTLSVGFFSDSKRIVVASLKEKGSITSDVRNF